MHKMVPEKPKRAFWVVHDLETAPQFHEKQNTETFWEGAGKTSATLWVPTLDRPHPGRTTEITDILSQELDPLVELANVEISPN